VEGEFSRQRSRIAAHRTVLSDGHNTGLLNQKYSPVERLGGPCSGVFRQPTGSETPKAVGASMGKQPLR